MNKDLQELILDKHHELKSILKDIMRDIEREEIKNSQETIILMEKI